MTFNRRSGGHNTGANQFSVGWEPFRQLPSSEQTTLIKMSYNIYMFSDDSNTIHCSESNKKLEKQTT